MVGSDWQREEKSAQKIANLCVLSALKYSSAAESAGETQVKENISVRAKCCCRAGLIKEPRTTEPDSIRKVQNARVWFEGARGPQGFICS